MEEDDNFISKLLTDFQNGSLLKDNSASEKRENQDDYIHCNDHFSEDEEEDDQIYVHETVVLSEEEECGELDDDTEEKERAFYDDKPNVVEDIGEDEDEDEDGWIYNNEPNQYIGINTVEAEEEGNENSEKKGEDLYDDEEEGDDDDDDDNGEGEQGGGENIYETREIFIQPSRKRWRTNYNADRISDLNDDTLHHIMSFLPMKDNVRTGVLSKRWEHLWKDLSTLDFKQGHMIDKGEILKFLDFVNYTLKSCKCRIIRKFVLNYRGYIDDHDKWVDRAIHSLTQRGAEKVYLRFNINGSHGADELYAYELPQYLFNNSSLKELSLFNCRIAPIDNIRWSSLKSLSLEYIELSNTLVSEILKGCPNLGVLKITSCVGLVFLDIQTKSLEELVITHSFRNKVDWADKTVLKITAPYVTSLVLFGNFYRRRCLLANVSSLVKADLSLTCDATRDSEENCNYLLHILENLQHVEELTLGTWCNQVLSKNLDQFHRLTLRCKSLSIYPYVMNLQYNLGIQLLLNGSSYLEFLEVDMSFSNHNDSENLNDKLDENNFLSVSSHLKTVHIINFCRCHEESVLRLVKTVLEKAKELENMVIKTASPGYSKWSSCLVSQRFIQFTQKIMKFRRCSPKVEVFI